MDSSFMKLYIGVNTDDFILYKKGEIILIIIISQNRATRVATFEVCVRSPNACCITQVHYMPLCKFWSNAFCL